MNPAKHCLECVFVECVLCITCAASKHAEAHEELKQEVLRSKEVIAALELDKERLGLKVLFCVF
jgi:hypothetical protein